MSSLEQTRETIYSELFSEDSEVRASYLKLFERDVQEFAEAMAKAMAAWREIDAVVGDDEKRGYVAAIAYAAVTLHVTSMKLFLSGHIVAAGNLMRQVVESIALAILCSARHLDVLDRFMADRYSTNDAVRDVLRNAKTLKLKQDGLAALKASQDFYHKFSHISRLALATMISFSEDGIYLGASFDDGKLEAYRKEVNGRVGLAVVLPNILYGVKGQLNAW